jgi:hypothetical protein
MDLIRQISMFFEKPCQVLQQALSQKTKEFFLKKILFVFGLKPNLTKSSFNDLHFGYRIKLKRKKGSTRLNFISLESNRWFLQVIGVGCFMIIIIILNIIYFILYCNFGAWEKE